MLREAGNGFALIVVVVGIHVLVLRTRSAVRWVADEICSGSTDAVSSLFVPYSSRVALAGAGRSSVAEGALIAFAGGTLLIPVWVLTTDSSRAAVTTCVSSVFARLFTFTVLVHVMAWRARAVGAGTWHCTIRYRRTDRGVAVMRRIWTGKHAGTVRQVLITKGANTGTSTLVFWYITVTDLCTLPFHRLIAVVLYVSTFYRHLIFVDMGTINNREI